jgi:hypothetical protein
MDVLEWLNVREADKRPLSAQEWQAIRSEILRLREEAASLHVALPAARFRAEQDDHHAR